MVPPWTDKRLNIPKGGGRTQSGNRRCSAKEEVFNIVDSQCNKLLLKSFMVKVLVSRALHLAALVHMSL